MQGIIANHAVYEQTDISAVAETQDIGRLSKLCPLFPDLPTQRSLRPDTTDAVVDSLREWGSYICNP